MESFPNHGFVATGSELDIVMLAADAHFGYYRERTFVQRLHAYIILPARQQGYQHILLLGLSMGRFGTVLCINLRLAVNQFVNISTCHTHHLKFLTVS